MTVLDVTGLPGSTELGLFWGLAVYIAFVRSGFEIRLNTEFFSVDSEFLRF